MGLLSVLTILYRVLFYLGSVFNAFFVFFLFWDLGAFPKYFAALLCLALFLTLTFCFYQGFHRPKRHFFPFPTRRVLTSALASLVWFGLLIWSVIERSLWPACLLSVWTFQCLLAVCFLLWDRRPFRSTPSAQPKISRSVFVCFATLVATVFLMNLMNSYWHFGALKPDPILGVRLAENPRYDIDRDGCRGGCAVTPFKRGPRILFLGDSSTFGVYVPSSKSYPAQAIACLQNQSVAAEGVNAAVPGFNLWMMLHRYEELAPSSWDWVTVMAGYHVHTIPLFEVQGPGGVFSRTERGAIRAVNTLDAMGFGLLRFPLLVALSGSIWGQPSRFSKETEHGMFIHNLEDLDAKVRSHGSRLLIVIYPSAMVDAQLQSRIVDFASTHNLSILDLRTEFSASPEELLVDGLHPTPEGHQVIAKAICQTILESRKDEKQNG